MVSIVIRDVVRIPELFVSDATNMITGVSPITQDVRNPSFHQLHLSSLFFILILKKIIIFFQLKKNNL